MKVKLTGFFVSICLFREVAFFCMKALFYCLDARTGFLPIFRWTSAFFLFWGSPIYLLGTSTWPIPPQTISTPGVNADSPQVAVDPSGNVIAIWIENQTVVSKSRTLNSDWGVLEYLSGSGSSSPQVVMDPSGTATAIWLNNEQVFTADKIGGGEWSSPETLSGSGASNCEMAIDQLGNIVITWLENGVVRIKTKPINSPWSEIATVISGPGAQNPDVAIGGNAFIVAVWEGNDQSIYSAHAFLGMQWSQPEQISDSNTMACNPSVAVDESGDAVAGWFRFNENNGQFSNGIVQASFYVGSAWLAPSDISNVNSPSIVDPHQLDLIVKKKLTGSAVAAWSSSTDGSYYNVEWAICRQGVWRPSNPLVSNVIVSSFGLDLDWRNYGYFAATYLDLFGAISLYGGMLIFDYPDKNGVVENMFPWLFTTTGNSCCNFISSSQSGPMNISAMVWKNYSGSSIAVQFTLAKVPVIEPPTDLVVTQKSNNYGVLMQYNNELSWSPSISNDVCGYILYRNGVYLCNLLATQLSYVDFNQGDQSGIYTIIAISKYGIYSDEASINFP